MKTLMENWRELVKDNTEEERVCLNRDAFDLLMQRIGDAYDEHLDQMIVEDEQQEKIRQACAKSGLYSFRHFLNIYNAFELAQKGKLNEPQK